MRKSCLRGALLIILSSLFVMTAMAAVDFSLPISNQDNNWYAGTGPDWSPGTHYGADAYAYDFNINGAATADVGQPVFAAADGTVTVAGYTMCDRCGVMVKISHADGFQTVYMHLGPSGFAAKVGNIKKGDLLGYIGTYAENGHWVPHLHFAIHSNGAAYNPALIPIFDAIPKRATVGGVLTQFVNWVSGSTPGTGGTPAEPLKPIDLKPIGDMVTNLYNWALDIGVAVALGIVIWGGVLYISSAGDPRKQNEAKKWVKAAILGLIILLTGYLILYTINPCLVGTGSGCA